MTARGLALWAAFLLCAAVRGPAAEVAILDVNSYWRSNYSLRPPYTSTRHWKTMKLSAGNRRYGSWIKAGRDMKKFPGGRHRYVWPEFSHHMATSNLTMISRTPPPAAGWEKPGFDDGTWPRTRYPLLMQAVGKDQVDNDNHHRHNIGAGFFRARFVVDDPARIKKLTLRVAYRGGLAAWINGHEVGRRHMIKGAAESDDQAEPYPEIAYTLPPAGERKANYCVPDIGGRHRTAIAWVDRYFRYPLTGDEWKATLKRRNRVLGPVEIPGKLLRKGVNVLALQVVRADFHPIVNFGKKRLGSNTHYGWIRSASWSHGCIIDVALRADSPAAAKPQARPAGVQLWAADVNRRVFDRDFGEPGKRPAVLRLAGARAGSFSAQLVIGTDRELRGLSAKAGALKGPGGAVIPAGAVEVRYAAGRNVRDLARLGVGRNPTWARKNPLRCSDLWVALWRYSPKKANGELPFRRYFLSVKPDYKTRTSPQERAANAKAISAAMNAVRFFDELAPRPPAAVPAGSCQPVWVTVKVPEKAPAGLYTGEVTVTAGGAALGKAELRVHVFDWRLPDPARGRDFSTFVGFEQSPWGVAKAHKVKPWSAEHFKHMEKSARRMAELGNDYLIIPVLLDSEFGNREDSFVVWVKGRDGKLSCDFSRFDKYMDMVQKHSPKPRAVCFGVAHPAENSLWVVPRVLMRDQATGKTAPFIVPMGAPNPFRGKGRGKTFSAAEQAEAKAFWKPFVAGMLKRMKTRGIEKSTYWGFVWDYANSVERYARIFNELAPGVTWTRGAHHAGIRGVPGSKAVYGCQGLIIAFKNPIRRQGGGYVIHSYKGWKSKEFTFSIPRAQNGVLCAEGRAAPFAWRLYPELALASGAVGIGRLGLDAWEWTYQDGWRGGGQVGMSVISLLWPGKEQANSSARFEMLREGLQEAEARVVIEKKLETAPDKASQKILDDRLMATLHIPRHFYISRIAEQHPGWQERSWDLYAAAAAASGGRAPSAADKQKFFGGK